MTIEFWLLLLESLLLVATVILLIYNIHEGKQRDNLLLEVGKATKVLTRQEYFFILIDTMLDAQQEIIGCITGSLPTGDDIKMTRNITAAIEKMAKKGVRIKYLLPKFPDRLQVGVQYSQAGAEVRFSSCLMVHSIRYSIVDETIVVFGIPESTGDKEATKKGYRIPSEELALILKDYFNSCEKQMTLKEYLREIIEQTGATPEQLAREFRLDARDLKQILQ
jgi:hypothetical protein